MSVCRSGAVPLTTRGRQRGVSLIELMIAMAIGLIMILAVSRLYLASAESTGDAQARAMLTDKMRLLQERFGYEFRRADFWGRVSADAERTGTLTVGADCGGAFAFGRADDTLPGWPLGIWAADVKPADCNINDAMAGQSYVVVRYAGEPCTPDASDSDEACDAAALRSFYPSIRFFSSNAGKPALPKRAGDSDHWNYEGSLYYLRDNSTLWRLRLAGGVLVNQEILRGVVALGYRWHDSNKNGDDAWLSTNDLEMNDMLDIDAVEIEAVVSTDTRVTHRDARNLDLADGREIIAQPGRLYRHFSFVVPLEMHRLSDDNE